MISYESRPICPSCTKLGIISNNMYNGCEDAHSFSSPYHLEKIINIIVINTPSIPKYKAHLTTYNFDYNLFLQYIHKIIIKYMKWKNFARRIQRYNLYISNPYNLGSVWLRFYHQIHYPEAKIYTEDKPGWQRFWYATDFRSAMRKLLGP
jgi:hypothetical protein